MSSKETVPLGWHLCKCQIVGFWPLEKRKKKKSTDSSPTLVLIAPNVAGQKDAEKLHPTSAPILCSSGSRTPETLRCPVDGALPKLAFIFSLEVCLGYHEIFFYISQYLSVLEPIKQEKVLLVTGCVPQHQTAILPLCLARSQQTWPLDLPHPFFPDTGVMETVPRSWAVMVLWRLGRRIQKDKFRSELEP